MRPVTSKKTTQAGQAAPAAAAAPTGAPPTGLPPQSSVPEPRRSAAPTEEVAGSLAVLEEESPWTPQELDAVRRELSAEVDRLRREIAHAESDLADLLRDAGDGAGDDQADAGSKAFEREHEMSLANNARDLLVQNERALERIEQRTYGVCENCGRPIGKERLMVFPRATLCVSCKQRQERR